MFIVSILARMPFHYLNTIYLKKVNTKNEKDYNHKLLNCSVKI